MTNNKMQTRLACIVVVVVETSMGVHRSMAMVSPFSFFGTPFGAYQTPHGHYKYDVQLFRSIKPLPPVSSWRHIFVFLFFLFCPCPVFCTIELNCHPPSMRFIFAELFFFVRSDLNIVAKILRSVTTTKVN